MSSAELILSEQLLTEAALEKGEELHRSVVEAIGLLTTAQFQQNLSGRINIQPKHNERLFMIPSPQSRTRRRQQGKNPGGEPMHLTHFEGLNEPKDFAPTEIAEINYYLPGRESRLGIKADAFTPWELSFRGHYQHLRHYYRIMDLGSVSLALAKR